ncbi:Gp37-like protein [Gordonia insulae]|uniref:Gp28/Gp37-like domain-containing protein n=1 Tax=Gordonia insulae TaxID=2420509 RepID=A0A3G8JGR1_9ACTN|nr:hypothetical protein [Gordonia insulae]AZG43440.1 hypothetical protein D7316_00004 [Gordonia insulae]
MTAPGYARPNNDEAAFDYFDVGRRSGTGANSVIEWRPIGRYERAMIKPTWGLAPEEGRFSLAPDHPLVDQIRKDNIDTTCWHFRAGYNGLPAFSGRIMDVDFDGAPGRAPWEYTVKSNKTIWLSSMNAWVNNLFPPEVQFNITGKQDIRWGWPDPVMKSYLASVATRLDVPVFAALPIKQPEGWEQPDLDDIDSVEDLLDLIFDIGEGGVGLQARFPSLTDLFTPTIERLEMGVTMNVWDGHGTSPQVFNTSSLAALQSIINYSSDNFLDLTQLLKPVNDGLWSYSMNRAGYVFDTHLKRDRRNVQFRSDAGQIGRFKYHASHPTLWQAIVGGKSPSVINDVIEIGANLAIAAIIAAIATIPGAGGIAGLSVGVGDLFDNVFFAYQVFWDHDIRNAVGPDDCLPERFADNTAAHSLDAYAVAHKMLDDEGGKESLVITATAGTADGRGISFGADNGTARRYQLGDTITCWDAGNVVEQYVSEVSIEHVPGEAAIEQPTIGFDKRAQGPWDRAFGLLGQAQGGFAALANAI